MEKGRRRVVKKTRATARKATTGAKREAKVLRRNLTAAELETYLGERIMERLMDLGTAMVPFTWTSHRRRG